MERHYDVMALRRSFGTRLHQSLFLFDRVFIPSFFLRFRYAQSASFRFWASAQTTMYSATLLAHYLPSFARQSKSGLGTTKLCDVFAGSVSVKIYDFTSTP